MKISICEVCAYRDNKLTRGAWNSGLSGMKISLCEEHKDFLSGLKTREAITEKVLALFKEQGKWGADSILA